MARFQSELPTELMKTFEMLGANTRQMMEEMTRAGAEVVHVNVIANVPAAFRGSDIMNCLKVTETYKTPSDGAINTKVAFYGYFVPKKSPGPKWIAERGTDNMAAELVCNVYEYGRSGHDFPKHPFIRKSFRKDQIEAAMKKVEAKYIPGGGD